VPSVVLFSGTNLRRQWRQWSRRTLVLHSRVRCRPCHLKTCPIASHPCMRGIGPARVHAAARRWLAANERLGAWSGSPRIVTSRPEATVPGR